MVSHLLSRTEYNDEEIVFAAAINWFEYNPVCRATHVEELLMDVIRLPQLAPEFLSGVVLCHPQLKAWDETKLKSLVDEAIEYQITPMADRAMATNEIRYLKRKGRKTTMVVQYLHCQDGIKKATFVSWDSPVEMTTYAGLNCYYHGISLLNGKMYVFGGYSKYVGQTVSSIKVFHEETQVWQAVESTMTVPRSHQTTIGTFNSSAWVLV